MSYDTQTHARVHEETYKKTKQWTPVLKRKLDQKFSEKYLNEACDTAYFVLNDNVAIICHKLYAGKTNYYPDNWPSTTVEVIIAIPDYPSYPKKPADPTLISILHAHSSDIQEYRAPEKDSFNYNSRCYNYDGSSLYLLLTQFANMGANLAPLSNLKEKLMLYINDHGYG
jgi:hypothetical protein